MQTGVRRQAGGKMHARAQQPTTVGFPSAIEQVISESVDRIIRVVRISTRICGSNFDCFYSPIHNSSSLALDFMITLFAKAGPACQTGLHFAS